MMVGEMPYMSAIVARRSPCSTTCVRPMDAFPRTYHGAPVGPAVFPPPGTGLRGQVTRLPNVHWATVHKGTASRPSTARSTSLASPTDNGPGRHHHLEPGHWP